MTVKSGKHEIRIYALLSGFISEKEGRNIFVRRVLTNKFAQAQPVWVYLIVHPRDGLYLIDTGQHPGSATKEYFKPAGKAHQWFLSTQFRYDIKEEHRLEDQLHNLGYGTKDITAVVLTHLHFDHTGNLNLFTGTPILLSKAEWVKPYYAVQALHPGWLKPELVLFSETEPSEDKLLEKTYIINSSGDLIYIATPGHTHGHASVMVQGDDFAVLLAGDISQSKTDLYNLQPVKGEANPYETSLTRWKVIEYAKTRPLLYLSSHDPAVEQQMINKDFLL